MKQFNPLAKMDSSLEGVGGFVVVAPNYSTQSAGTRAMYLLCQDLRRTGVPAVMCGGSLGRSFGDLLVVSEERGRELCAAGYVAIYPETISGNPLGAGTVVRWVLNRPGLLGGDLVYAPSEIVFTYSEVYRPYIANTVAGRLYLPIIDEELFWSPPTGTIPREIDCFYIGKSQWKGGVVDRNNALEITRSWPDRSELGKILRRARALYCFDNSTMLIYEALLCGCPVVVIPDGTQRWEDYLSLELGVDGISWGTQGFSPGEFDASVLRSRISRARSEYRSQFELLLSSVRSRTTIRNCDDSQSLSLTVLPQSLSGRTRFIARKMRSGLRSIEAAFRRGRRAAVQAIARRMDSARKQDGCGCESDAANYFVPEPRVRTLNCHVDIEASDLSLGGFDKESVWLNPAKPFDPRAVAFLLGHSKRVIFRRPWKAVQELASRCGCEIVTETATNPDGST